MPVEKLPFQVIYASGWEDEHHPSNLHIQNHQPAAIGWHSQRSVVQPVSGGSSYSLWLSLPIRQQHGFARLNECSAAILRLLIAIPHLLHYPPPYVPLHLSPPPSQPQRRFCTFPQTLVLRLSTGKSRLRKVQLLAHHFMIPNRIDIFVGNLIPQKTAFEHQVETILNQIHFNRLG